LDYGKNSIGVNIFEFFFSNIGIYYERIFFRRKLSIKIPISIDAGGKPVPDNFLMTSPSFVGALRNKNYAAGLEFNLIPLKAGRFNFYVGCSALWVNFNYYTYNGLPYYYSRFPYNKHVRQMYAFMVHFGGNVGISDHIFVGAKAAVGYRYFETIAPHNLGLRAQLDINFSYRF
jgi:hypothetical protein